MLARTMLDRLDSTIVAISSAWGHGLMGIVRLSGPEAIAIADRMAATATKEPLAARPTWTQAAGEVLIDGERSLPAMFNVFRAPHSYTREDVVEVLTVGSPAALELVRRRAVELGALPAEPGEFTARAFLSGAMDLPSAEAVVGVIRAQTDAQLRASRRMMDGTLAKQITAVRDQLANLVALVEADIDFAEEPIEFIAPDSLRDRLSLIGNRLNEVLAGAGRTERFDVLPHILLLGPPNSGKSSLMNRLSGISRAICAAAAGTTRDILSAPIRLGRGEAILLDSAGIGESEDEIVTAACAMTMSAARQVDLVCLVADLSSSGDAAVLQTARSVDAGAVVVAANKADLVPAAVSARRVRELEQLGLGPVRLVSALTGAGTESLRDAFAEALGAAATTTLSQSVLLSERQRHAVAEGAEAIGRAVALAETARETIDCAELLAFELREALDALGTVTGEVATEDLLNQIFANFCIGK